MSGGTDGRRAIRIVYVREGPEFALSPAARDRLQALAPNEDFTRHGEFDEGMIPRAHPALVQVVEDLREAAGAKGVALGIVEVSEGVRCRMRWSPAGHSEIVETEAGFLARELPTFFPARAYDPDID